MSGAFKKRFIHPITFERVPDVSPKSLIGNYEEFLPVIM